MKTQETIEIIENYIAFNCPSEKLGLAYEALGYQKAILKHRIEKDNRLEFILKKCCEVCNVKVKDAKGKERKREFVLSRKLYCFLASTTTKKSLSKIGFVLKVDHATVLYHKQDVAGRIYPEDCRVTDRSLLSKVEQLAEILNVTNLLFKNI
jgi:chromosomal replication initiation ATPase DnaA